MRPLGHDRAAAGRLLADRGGRQPAPNSTLTLTWRLIYATPIIEVNKLEKSSLNARRTATKGAAEDMKASILAHGLMQNLVVTAGGDGIYRVIAGGRRLEAMKVAGGRQAARDYAVPCQVASDEHAVEMSLAENTVRLAMHPADEFEAFAG